MKIIYSITLLALLNACANMVTPTGGKKDDKIPALIYTNLVKTNFKGKQLILQFDENVILENNPDLITIQPKHTTFKFDNSSKIIKIKLDSSLKENTTYILDISGGIKDLNEGNKYSLDYIFSTGPSIDTNYITYKINHFEDYKNLKIGLTKLKVDSIHKLKFDYIYTINNDNVTIMGLGNNSLNNWIFTDKNNDNIPDEYMPVYYDTIEINSTRQVSLNNWRDSRNINTVLYNRFTKIIKPINDISTYSLQYPIYIDKDSSLFYNTNSDTLPLLNLKRELSNKINSKSKGIKSIKDYTIIIDKCGINNLSITDKISYKEDENYFYINSKLKLDSVNIKALFLKDTVNITIKNIKYQSSNTVGTIKINRNNLSEPVIMVVIQNNKIDMIKRINLMKEQIFFMDPGTYKFIFYKTDLYDNTGFNFEKLQRVNCPVLEKEIILKPNWDEVLQLNFN